MLLWSGARDVSRHVFEKVIKDEKGDVLLLPGGQAEMEKTMHASPEELVLCTKHIGFCKIALQTCTDIVPILSFGEQQLMNLATLPQDIQTWLIKNCRILPCLPYGRFGLPVPNDVTVTVVVGKPIPTGYPAIQEPSREQVQALADTYFEALDDLCRRYRDKAGFPKMRLVMKDK
jgi:2-acylglycerol O-acyltransferase 2